MNTSGGPTISTSLPSVEENVLYSLGFTATDTESHFYSNQVTEEDV